MDLSPVFDSLNRGSRATHSTYSLLDVSEEDDQESSSVHAQGVSSTYDSGSDSRDEFFNSSSRLSGISLLPCSPVSIFARSPTCAADIMSPISSIHSSSLPGSPIYNQSSSEDDENYNFSLSALQSDSNPGNGASAETAISTPWPAKRRRVNTSSAEDGDAGTEILSTDGKRVKLENSTDDEVWEETEADRMQHPATRFKALLEKYSLCLEDVTKLKDLSHAEKIKTFQDTLKTMRFLRDELIDAMDEETARMELVMVSK